MRSRAYSVLLRFVSAWSAELWLALALGVFFALAEWLGLPKRPAAEVILLIYLLIVAAHRLLLIHRQRQWDQTGKDLEDSHKKLLLVSDVKNRFIATISHELRTPITAIQECIKILNDGIAAPLQGAQGKFLEMAQRNVDRLTGLLDNLLDLSRLENEGMRATFTAVPVNDLVLEAVNALQPKAQKHGVELCMDIPPNLPAALVDRLRAMQVLNELLDNAIKFSPAGGKAGITARRPDGSDHLVLCVWDSGRGMSQETMRHLFDQFHALDAKEDYASPGMGLGLSICKEIVTQMEGSIWAENRAEGGSNIYFTLMCSSDDALLKAHFRHAMRDAQVKKLPFLHLGVRVRDVEVLRMHFGSYLVEEMLEEVGRIVRSCVRMDDRVAVDHQEGMVHVMMLFGRGPVPDRVRKLDNSLRNKVFFAGFSELNVGFVYGAALFPSDGQDLPALKAQVMKQIRAGGVDINTLPWADSA